jgi:hypothetical protein
VRYVHVAVGIALFIVPLVSLVFGSGTFAWTMYSGSGEYWLEVRVKDADARWHSVAPTALAGSTPSGALLAGADHYRRGTSVDVLRTHLSDLARYACAERHGVVADVVLHERRDANAVERATSAHVECP